MTEAKSNNISKAPRNLAIFGGVAVVWLLLDQWTKSFFVSIAEGTRISDSFFGIFHFQLVHNTGGAWSIFSDATMMLGVASLLVCLLLAGILIFFRDKANLAEALSIGLIVSGGLGNVIDRFVQSYVTDFICLDFMDFPVFNVADIGVTCGFVILIIAIILHKEEE